MPGLEHFEMVSFAITVEASLMSLWQGVLLLPAAGPMMAAAQLMRGPATWLMVPD